MTAQDPDRRSTRLLATLAGRLAAAVALWRSLARREAPAPPASDGADTDPREREVPANRRAETLVAGLLVLAAVFGFGFTAAYAIEGTNPRYLGIALGGALVLLSAACVIAGKLVVPQETHVEERGLLLDERQSEEVVDMLEDGGEGISRRALLGGAAGLAGAGMITALATPLASLGPRLAGAHETPWHRGVGLVDDQGRPYRAADIVVGSLFTALPEHGDRESLGAGLIVVRLPPEYLYLPAARRGWAPEGIVAYSKICPHAGCAISLYRYPLFQPTSDGPAFTCPCHYSTFLPGEGGRVVFGPAGRSLSQLPLMIDAAGMLRAAGPFREDIGPSWWSVRRSES
jgi:ubiquinol-cytochrome c reductase iron-sulfur subunit